MRVSVESSGQSPHPVGRGSLRDSEISAAQLGFVSLPWETPLKLPVEGSSDQSPAPALPQPSVVLAVSGSCGGCWRILGWKSFLLGKPSWEGQVPKPVPTSTLTWGW